MLAATRTATAVHGEHSAAKFRAPGVACPAIAAAHVSDAERVIDFVTYSASGTFAKRNTPAPVPNTLLSRIGGAFPHPYLNG